jgi:CheY-like chemotaxis protein
MHSPFFDFFRHHRPQTDSQGSQHTRFCDLTERRILSEAPNLKTMNPTKIYYVEDDPDDAALLTEAFAGYGYDITIFPNPVELFHQLHAEELLPTLIILDINLPLMNGIEALRLLKAEPKFVRIPVALLSTNSRKDSLIDDKNLYFIKPSQFHDYEKIVARLLAYSQGELQVNGSSLN